MFEEEVELEKHQSSVLPLLLIVTLVLVVVGLAGYHLRESRKVLTVPDAANAVINVLKAQGPATIRFHTGLLVSSVADKPTEPHYRLLEKAGILKTGHGIAFGRPVPVALTPKGEQLLSQISGVKRLKTRTGAKLMSSAGRKKAGGRLQNPDGTRRSCQRRVHLDVGAESIGRKLRCRREQR